jgi:hypothetical protein
MEWDRMAFDDLGVSVRRDEQNFDLTENAASPLSPRGDYRAWDVTVGPRLRRFMRSGAGLSPYWDVFVNALASEWHSSGGFAVAEGEKSHGIGGGLAFGVEWETPWHVSVAAHSDFLTLQWEHSQTEITANNGTNREEGDSYRTLLELAPGLFARFYF